jgi:hypothetical protein
VIGDVIGIRLFFVCITETPEGPAIYMYLGRETPIPRFDCSPYVYRNEAIKKVVGLVVSAYDSSVELFGSITCSTSEPISKQP